MAAFKLVEKDTRPTRLTYRVDGLPVDITGYQFTMKIGYAPVLAKAAVLADPVNGIIEFQWLSTDLKPGNWAVEVLVVDAGGKEKTHPISSLKIESRMT